MQILEDDDDRLLVAGGEDHPAERLDGSAADRLGRERRQLGLTLRKPEELEQVGSRLLDTDVERGEPTTDALGRLLGGIGLANAEALPDNSQHREIRHAAGVGKARALEIRDLTMG